MMREQLQNQIDRQKKQTHDFKLKEYVIDNAANK